MRSAIEADGIRRRLGVLAVAATILLMAHDPVSAAGWPKSSSPAPTTTAAAWALIDQNLARLEALIKAGKLDDLGSSAYGIANAFKLLPGLPSSLPADPLAEVRRDVNIVGGEVSKLDKAGEHNDAGIVKSELAALKATLASVRGYYPH